MEDDGSLNATAPIALNSTAAGRKVRRPGTLIVMAAACLVTWVAQPALAAPLDDARAALSRGDAATAQRIYRSLADRGNVIAMTRLGMMYRAGQGIPRDYREALR